MLKMLYRFPGLQLVCLEMGTFCFPWPGTVRQMKLGRFLTKSSLIVAEMHQASLT